MNLCEEIQKLVREYAIADEKLTREQLAEAFRQALACGDFQRHVVIGRGSRVIYLPGAEVYDLKAKISELEEEVRSLEIKAEELANDLASLSSHRK